MSMNFLDAAGVLADSAELPFHDLMAREATEIVQATVNDYDALAPDWNEEPEWAKWYAIDANGSAAWYKQQPKYDEFCDKWLFGSGSYLHEYHWAGEKDDIAIPLGMDWRLLVWQRPVQEVQNG